MTHPRFQIDLDGSRNFLSVRSPGTANTCWKAAG